MVLSGWLHQKAAVISGQAGAGTNYVKFFKVYFGTGDDGAETLTGGHNGVQAEKMYCHGDCKTDFSDLRFTDNNDNQLDQFRDSYTSGVSSLWAVEVAESLASAQTVKVHFGNPTASLLSSAANTFRRVISSGVVLALPMNEGAGNCTDYSGNGNTGTLGAGAGAPTWVTTGKFGNGISFDGSDDYVNLGNVATWNLAATAQTTGVSFVAWLNAAVATGDDWAMIMTRYGGGLGYNIYMRNAANGGKITSNWDATTDDASKTTTNAMNDGVTHSLFSIMDPDANVLDLYVDNVQQGAVNAFTDDLTQANMILYLGGEIGATSWKGVLSYFLILSYDLSQPERSDLQAYYPQCSSSNLGTLYLRSYVNPEPQHSHWLPETHADIPSSVYNKRRTAVMPRRPWLDRKPLPYNALVTIRTALKELLEMEAA